MQLIECKGNVSRTAKRLKVHRNNVTRWLKEMKETGGNHGRSFAIARKHSSSRD